MDLLLLGPIEVHDGDATVELGAAKQRALLALLLLDAGRAVSVERLVDELWGESAPPSARKMVQIHVSALRKLMPAGLVRTSAAGYSIEIPPEDLDLGRFERLAARGRAALAAGSAQDAAARLRAALSLWRGPALVEFAEPFAARERARLEALRLAALEDRIEADLALGRHAEVVAELESVLHAQPHRERLRGQHMLALYRSGRQAEALASYRDAWRSLDEELGIRPSPELRRLEQRILAQDSALAAPAVRGPAARVDGGPAGVIRYASSGDVSLAYQVFGHGDAELVLVTGWVLPIELFRDEPGFARFLDRLAGFARVLVWDKRGTGLSDRIAPGARPTLEERTGDLTAVMDAAGFERPAILGLSEGCHLAALFAATHPQRTATLALYGGWARTMWAPDYPSGATRAQHRRLIELVREHWGDAAYLLRYWAPDAQDDEQLRTWWARALRLGATPTAAVTWLELMEEVDIRSALTAIQAPTLVAHRRGDVIVPVSHGRHLAEHIPEAEYVELPGTDHLWWVGDQDALVDTVERFFARARRIVDPPEDAHSSSRR